MAILLPDARELSDDVLEALRLRALRGCELGLTEVQVAGLLGVARETVCRWWAAYAGHGVPALPQRRSGRPLGSGRALSDAQAEHLQQLVRTHQPGRIGHRGAAVDPPCRPRPDPQGIRSRSGGADRRPVSEAAGLHGQAAAVTPVIKTPKRSGNGWRKPIRPSRARANREGAEIHWGDEVGVAANQQPARAKRRGGKPRPRMCRTRTSERTKSRRSRTTARFGS